MKLTGTYRKLVKNTTINGVTLLSTDYLNHYNELVMMLEMVADMPDMLEEAEAWEPKTYQDHFRDSVFQHKDLAIMAYENAPDEYREPVDDCIARIDTEIETGIPALRTMADKGEIPLLQESARSLTLRMRGLLDTMSALINGAMDQETYNASLADEALAEHDEKVMDQTDIDALFD